MGLRGEFLVRSLEKHRSLKMGIHHLMMVWDPRTEILEASNLEALNPEALNRQTLNPEGCRLY